MASEGDSTPLLQFLPFSSVVSSDFWHKLSQLKIDVLALSEEPVDITGYFSNHTAAKLPACFNVDYSSFEKYILNSLTAFQMFAINIHYAGLAKLCRQQVHESCAGDL